MKILTASQIREADAYTIANEPVKSIDLMERAAKACSEWIMKRYDKKNRFTIFCGIGNNGGDGLAIARMLHGKGYTVEVNIVRFSEKCSEDFFTNEKRLKGLKKISPKSITSAGDAKETFLSEKTDGVTTICIDAILGSGLSRPAEGLAAEIIREINKSRLPVISIDIPSGLFCESNSGNPPENIIKAEVTLTFEGPKLAFMFPGNSDYVGAWQIIQIGLHREFIAGIKSSWFFVTKDISEKIIRKRKKFSHKGSFGHSLLVCGSFGKMGAAVLAAGACMRSGTGLATVHVPKCGYFVLQSAVPEVMVSVDDSEHFVTSHPRLENFNAIGTGPGIGTEKQTQNMLKLLIQNSRVPLVFDADAINIFSENKTWLSFIPPNSIFTPHPGEFERLAGKSRDNSERLSKQTDFARKFKCFVILKGAHTGIACPDGSVFFNSTGNPGMATGGSGDVLTGILTSLLAQGYSPKEACILGVYLHGSAGDIASKKTGMHSLIAGDIIENLGEAFLSLSSEIVP